MMTARMLAAALLALPVLAQPVAAAVPKEKIHVTFCNAQPDSDPGASIPELPYVLEHGGSLRYGGRLYAEDLFLCRVWSRFAERIEDWSKNRDRLRVLLAVDDPADMKFAAVAQCLDRLTRIAAENANEGCEVEIVVFPMPSITTAPTPDETPAARGPDGRRVPFEFRIVPLGGDDKSERRNS